MPDQAQLLPGTFDLLVLRAVSLGPLHGYRILLRIAQISGHALSDANRRARFYELTAAGRKRLRDETESWDRLATAIASALSTQPGEL